MEREGGLIRWVERVVGLRRWVDRVKREILSCEVRGSLGVVRVER